MTISELAARTGHSVHAIRFYERCGVLPRADRTGSGRRFDDDDVEKLAWIADAKRVGLTLREIGAALGEAAPDEDHAMHERAATLTRRIIALRAREAELAQLLGRTRTQVELAARELHAIARELPQALRVTIDSAS